MCRAARCRPRAQWRSRFRPARRGLPPLPMVRLCKRLRPSSAGLRNRLFRRRRPHNLASIRNRPSQQGKPHRALTRHPAKNPCKMRHRSHPQHPVTARRPACLPPILRQGPHRRGHRTSRRCRAPRHPARSTPLPRRPKLWLGARRHHTPLRGRSRNRPVPQRRRRPVRNRRPPSNRTLQRASRRPAPRSRRARRAGAVTSCRPPTPLIWPAALRFKLPKP